MLYSCISWDRRSRKLTHLPSNAQFSPFLSSPVKSFIFHCHSWHWCCIVGYTLMYPVVYHFKWYSIYNKRYEVVHILSHLYVYLLYSMLDVFYKHTSKHTSSTPIIGMRSGDHIVPSVYTPSQHTAYHVLTPYRWLNVINNLYGAFTHSISFIHR